MSAISISSAPCSLATSSHTASRKHTLRVRCAASATSSAEIKKKLKLLCKDAPDNGVTAPPELRAQIVECIEDLEKINPTLKPATEGAKAGKLDGYWQLLYSDSPGPSSGQVGPLKGVPRQELNFKEGYVINSTEIGPLKVALRAHGEIVDDQKWKLFKKDFPPNKFGRWRMTYVDEDLRILKTLSDLPDATESTYALQRVSKG